MQFRQLMVAVIVIAASTVVADDCLDESKTIEKVELLGGKVWRDQKLPGKPVIEVDFQGSAKFNEKYLHLLRAFPQLTKLNLLGKKITDCGLIEIGEFKSLLELWVYEAQITDEGVTKLKDSLPKMNVRFFGHSTIGFNNEAIQPAMGRFLIHGINGVAFGTNKIAQLDTRNIKEVDLSNVEIKDDHLQSLRKIEQLTTLVLAHTEISDDGLSYISDFRNLTTLSLAHTRITDSGTKEVSKLSKLTNLSLLSTKISDEGLKDFGKLKRLTVLNLRSTLVTDESVKTLKLLTTLKTLSIGATEISDAGLKELQDALPDLKIER